jgi:hypothetical protein
MYAFEKLVRKADQTRHFTIRPIQEGWELCEEENSRVVRQTHYRDWHRVERARRALVQEVSTLRENGWQEA